MVFEAISNFFFYKEAIQFTLHVRCSVDISEVIPECLKKETSLIALKQNIESWTSARCPYKHCKKYIGCIRVILKFTKDLFSVWLCLFIFVENMYHFKMILNADK